MPDQIIDALNKEINLGLADPNIKACLAELRSAPLEVIAQVNDDEDVIEVCPRQEIEGGSTWWRA